MKFWDLLISAFLLVNYVNQVTSCRLSRCADLRQSAEKSFFDEQYLFCRSLQNYLVCLRKLSADCITHDHVQQVLNRYSTTCKNSRDSKIHRSYFEDTTAGHRVRKTDDKFDDIGEKLTKSDPKRNQKIDDLFDDVGDDTRKRSSSYDTAQASNAIKIRNSAKSDFSQFNRPNHHRKVFVRNDNNEDDDSDSEDDNSQSFLRNNLIQKTNNIREHNLFQRRNDGATRRWYKESDVSDESKEDFRDPIVSSKNPRTNRIFESDESGGSDSYENVWKQAFSKDHKINEMLFDDDNALSEYFDDFNFESDFGEHDDDFYWGDQEGEMFDDSDEYIPRNGKLFSQNQNLKDKLFNKTLRNYLWDHSDGSDESVSDESIWKKPFSGSHRINEKLFENRKALSEYYDDFFENKFGADLDDIKGAFEWDGEDSVYSDDSDEYFDDITRNIKSNPFRYGLKKLFDDAEIDKDLDLFSNNPLEDMEFDWASDSSGEDFKTHKKKSINEYFDDILDDKLEKDDDNNFFEEDNDMYRSSSEEHNSRSKYDSYQVSSDENYASFGDSNESWNPSSNLNLDEYFSDDSTEWSSLESDEPALFLFRKNQTRSLLERRRLNLASKNRATNDNKIQSRPKLVDLPPGVEFASNAGKSLFGRLGIKPSDNASQLTIPKREGHDPEVTRTRIQKAELNPVVDTSYQKSSNWMYQPQRVEQVKGSSDGSDIVSHTSTTTFLISLFICLIYVL